MQHRITLSTDLLIAVRDKSNKAKELKVRPSGKGIMNSEEEYAKHIEPYGNDEWRYTLYGHKHAEAV
jgi:hypothetical protein